MPANQSRDREGAVDQEKQVSTFEEHSQEVYAWAYRLLGRHHDALDVVQDVFLRWSRQCRESVPQQPRGWLRRVTINRAVDFCRRRLTLVPEFEGPATSQLRSITGWKAMPHASITGWNSTPHAIERGDEEAFRGDVAGAFDGLSDGQRIVLTAKVFDGLTFAEIAAEHDLAVSTVKTHYLRAVRAVRDRLAPRWGNAASPPRERAGRD